MKPKQRKRKPKAKYKTITAYANIFSGGESYYYELKEVAEKCYKSYFTGGRIACVKLTGKYRVK